MTNEKPPAPEETEKYLLNIARVRTYDLKARIGQGCLVIDERRRQLRECETELTALEREAFVLARWMQAL